MSQPSYCTPGDSLERLAVLGVLSQDTRENAALRRTSRSTWMQPDLSAQSPILARFVLRGAGIGEEALHEAQQHGDVIFVNEASNASYKTAPLRSLFAWLRCAQMAWPQARLIGKADDDVVVMAPRVAAHLLASFDALRRGGAEPLLYWGMMETMHWDVEQHRPASPFRFGYGDGQPCTRRRSPRGFVWPPGSFTINRANKLFWLAPIRRSDKPEWPLQPAAPGDVWRDSGGADGDGGGMAGGAEGDGDGGSSSHGLYIGPFFFAKGPLYFMSSELSRQMTADGALATNVAQTIASALNTTYREPAWPWEDIYTGLALAQVVRGGGGGGGGGKGGSVKGGGRKGGQHIVAVHIGNDAFMESFSMGRGAELALKPPMLVWHERAKQSHQMRDAHLWASQHGCTVRRLALSCRPSGWTSCSGAKWRLCSASHAVSEYERDCNDTRLRRADNSLWAPSLRRMTPHSPQSVRGRRAAGGKAEAQGRGGSGGTAVARP